MPRQCKAFVGADGKIVVENSRSDFCALSRLLCVNVRRTLAQI